MGAAVTVTTQDAMDIETETDIEETIRQLQLVSLRRLVERLRNELEEVRKDRDAWRKAAGEQDRGRESSMVTPPGGLNQPFL